jgi:hypothetical protein
MKRQVKRYSEFVNETEIKVVYPTNFSGMVKGAVSNIQSQILAIARELAAEKTARNPYRYQNSGTKIGDIDEVDIARAINLIFHSEWKKYLKKQDVRGWVRQCIERASKHDERANKKNQRAMRSMNKGKDSWTQASDFNKNNQW